MAFWGRWRHRINRLNVYRQAWLKVEILAAARSRKPKCTFGSLPPEPLTQVTDMTSHRNLDCSFDIEQLIFCSHAANAGDKPGFERDLRDILDHGRTCNLLHDITGALMTDGSMFAHVIEGPSVALKHLYPKIMRDQRHNRVLTLQHTLVHVRLFGLWPVAFLRVGAMHHAAALNARSRPVELRNASVCILKALRPILLR